MGASLLAIAKSIYYRLSIENSRAFEKEIQSFPFLRGQRIKIEFFQPRNSLIRVGQKIFSSVQLFHLREL